MAKTEMIAAENLPLNIIVFFLLCLFLAGDIFFLTDFFPLRPFCLPERSAEPDLDESVFLTFRILISSGDFTLAIPCENSKIIFVFKYT